MFLWLLGRFQVPGVHSASFSAPLYPVGHTHVSVAPHSELLTVEHSEPPLVQAAPTAANRYKRK